MYLDCTTAPAFSVPRDKLTHGEALIRNYMTDANWTVIRNGWPDFLCYHIRPDGSVRYVCIEVKYGPDKIRPSQSLMGRTLECLGMPVFVIREPKDLRELLRKEANAKVRPFRLGTLHCGTAIHPDEEEWIG